MKKQVLSGGQRIIIERFEPATAGCYPAVVMLHGLDGLETTGEFYRTAARRLAGQGRVVVLVHYFERTGTDTRTAHALVAPMRQFLRGQPLPVDREHEIRRLFNAWQQTVKDAVAQVRAEPHVQKESVGLVGFSLGAFLALSVAADPALQIAAVVDFFGGLPPGTPTTHLPPTLILHGDQDRIVSVEHARHLHQHLRQRGAPVECKVYTGVDHLFVNARGEVNWMAAWDAEARTHRFLGRHFTPARIASAAKVAR